MTNENIEKYLLSPEQTQQTRGYRDLTIGHQMIAEDQKLCRLELASLIEKGWKSPEEFRAMVEFYESAFHDAFAEGVKAGKRQVLGRLKTLNERKHYCTADFDQAVQELIQELEKELEGRCIPRT